MAKYPSFQERFVHLAQLKELAEKVEALKVGTVFVDSELTASQWAILSESFKGVKVYSQFVEEKS